MVIRGAGCDKSCELAPEGVRSLNKWELLDCGPVLELEAEVSGESHSASWEAWGNLGGSRSTNTFKMQFDRFLEGLHDKTAAILE